MSSESRLVYVIGDIHGCYDEFRRLEALVWEDANSHGCEPHLLCVGDIFDRGPKSKELCEHFIQGKKDGTHSLIMGNHELEFLRNVEAFRPDLLLDNSLYFPFACYSIDDDYKSNRYGANFCDEVDGFKQMVLASWVSQGGLETLQSYGVQPYGVESWDFPIEHLKFLTELPFLWEDDRIVVTHAFASVQDIEILKKYNLLASAEKNKLERIEQGSEQRAESEIEQLKATVQSCLWSRKPPTNRPDSRRVHISGHTPMEYVKVSKDLGFIQLDTACVYGKRLTAYCPLYDTYLAVKSKTIWSR